MSLQSQAIHPRGTCRRRHGTQSRESAGGSCREPRRHGLRSCRGRYAGRCRGTGNGFADATDALKSLGKIDGKVVIDITNPLTPDYMGLTPGHSTSAAEEIAKAVPGAEVVKAFNTVFAQVLADGPDFGQGRTVTVFVASDSERARQTASALAQSLGFTTVDAGGLKNARYLEPVAGLNIYLGYGAGLGTRCRCRRPAGTEPSAAAVSGASPAGPGPHPRPMPLRYLE